MFELKDWCKKKAKGIKSKYWYKTFIKTKLSSNA